jgi:hypothetical protein
MTWCMMLKKLKKPETGKCFHDDISRLRNLPIDNQKRDPTVLFLGCSICLQTIETKRISCELTRP